MFARLATFATVLASVSAYVRWRPYPHILVNLVSQDECHPAQRVFVQGRPRLLPGRDPAQRRRHGRLPARGGRERVRDARERLLRAHLGPHRLHRRGCLQHRAVLHRRRELHVVRGRGTDARAVHAERVRFLLHSTGAC
jgi:hypothetical protein